MTITIWMIGKIIYGTMGIHTPTDHSTDDKDTEPDNNACKRQRKVYAPVDTSRKELTN